MHLGNTAVDIGISKIRRQPNRLIQRDDGFVKAAQIQQGGCLVKMHGGIVWAGPQGAVQAFQRAARLPGLQAQHTELKQCLKLPGGCAQNVLVCRYSLLRPTGLHQCSSVSQKRRQGMAVCRTLGCAHCVRLRQSMCVPKPSNMKAKTRLRPATFRLCAALAPSGAVLTLAMEITINAGK